MKASLQLQPMYCSRDYNYSSRFNQQYEKSTQPFTHVKGLLYKHVSDTGKQFLALVIPKSWKFTILMEAHDKLGHQGNNRTYCLIK